MNTDGSMTVTKPKAKRARRPVLDDWHPDHPKNRTKQAASALAAQAAAAASATDPDPPPDITKARASARGKRAAKSK